MKTKIEKLIKTYQSKIKDCDISIESLAEEIREYRRKGDEIGKSSARGDQKHFMALSQSYVQFISDLECLED